MDSLTAHYLARELDERWRGKPLGLCLIEPKQRRIVVGVEGAFVQIDLSVPDVVVSEITPSDSRGFLAGWGIVGVEAPVDDRRLLIRLNRPGKFKPSVLRSAMLEVSVVPIGRAATLWDTNRARMAVIGMRLPPPAKPRPALDDATLETAARAGDTSTLLTGLWMSPLVAEWFIREPERAVERYHLILADAPAQPSRCDGKLVPFPMCPDAEPAASLIYPEAAGRQVERQRDQRIDRLRHHLEAELERARLAPAMRRLADTLVTLGRTQIPRPVTFPDGTVVPMHVRRGESAAIIAKRLYETSARLERALETLPARLAKLEREANTPPGERPLQPPKAKKPKPAGPFKTYRSSGGLDIWIGRGARENDDLTFRIASPNDVWLHARGASGAHVVLRWQRDEPPPARDLEEAAILAAWHSKARGSAVVPVDWTRRKYVHRSRGGTPGLVMLERSETIMARLDPQLHRKLKYTPPE